MSRNLLAKRMHPPHDDSMPSITIRDVPEATRDELAARARATGRSLQEYLLAELQKLAAKPSADEWLARVRERKRRTGSTLSREQILEALDVDRKWAEFE